MKVLNLYAGIGGNRKLWKDVEVTAIEHNPQIGKVYGDFFPMDRVLITDAHQFLLEHFKEFDFIWSSPPCPTHSQFSYRCGHLAWGRKPKYPDMNLYQEIILLQHHAKCKWVIENTESYYEPLVRPQKIARHYFWSNFKIGKFANPTLDIKKNTVADYEKMHEISLSGFDAGNKRLMLRNCVHPKLGLHIFNEAMKQSQKTLGVI